MDWNVIEMLELMDCSWSEEWMTSVKWVVGSSRRCDGSNQTKDQDGDEQHVEGENWSQVVSDNMEMSVYQFQ